MATLSEPQEALKIGTEITAAFVQNGSSRSVHCTVNSEVPLYLGTGDEFVSRLEYPRPVHLLWSQDDRLLYADAQVTGFMDGPEGKLLDVRHVKWEGFENRRYSRHRMQIPVALRVVCESDNETSIRIYSGTTVDLSLGGAWVKAQEEIAVGSLIEFSANLGDEVPFRALAVVAHRRARKNFGIEFLEIVGNGRISLSKYMSSAA